MGSKPRVQCPPANDRTRCIADISQTSNTSAQRAPRVGDSVLLPLTPRLRVGAALPTLGAATIAKILAHSDAQLLFVGKLDHWDRQQAGVPAHQPRIVLPLAPQGAAGAVRASWQAIVASTPPLAGNPQPSGDALATIIYTSGTTGEPKGVMHTFATLAHATESGCAHYAGRV